MCCLGAGAEKGKLAGTWGEFCRQAKEKNVSIPALLLGVNRKQ